MSQLRKTYLPSILTALVFSSMVFACGDANTQATYDPSGGHSGDWGLLHADEAGGMLDTCTGCHGETYDGGISGVACTDCHLGSETSLHALSWEDLVYARHGAFVKADGNTSCAVNVCHGADLTGVAESGPSCTSCHMGGVDSIHPGTWGSLAYTVHDGYVRFNGTASCDNSACHGPMLEGVAESGPSCTSCHMGGLNSIHPIAWDADITLHGDYVATMGSSTCRNDACHGPTLDGVPGSGPGCNICHLF